MFKRLLKFTVLVIAVIGVCTLFSGAKVAADDNCPTPNHGGNPPTEWGINTGSDTHGFASMTVHTTDSDGSDMDDVGFTLHSELPVPGPGYSYGSTPPGTTVNDRIFNWGTEGPGNTGRWNSYRFKTSETNYVGSNPHQVGPAQFHCPGWTELGPGVKVHRPGTPDIPANYVREDGNNFALDCVEVKTKPGSSVEVPVHFWIANVDVPSRDSTWGGHWSIIVHDSNGNRIAKVDDINADPMDMNHNDFAVNNGLNVRVDLIWNANPQPHHTGGGATPQCTNLDVTGSGEYQTSNGSWWDTYTHYRVTDGYYDASGNFVEVHTLADGGDSGYGPNPGHWTPSYQATEPSVKVHVERKYRHLDGTNWVETDIPGFPTTNYFNCFSAHCGLQEVDGNVPNGPGDGVIQGTQFRVRMYVTNDGPGTLSNPRLNGQLPDSNYYPLYHDASGGDTGYYTFYPIAPPGGPQKYRLNFSFADSGVGNFSATCFVDVPVFQYFNINPTATIAPGTNQENPYLTDGVTHGISYIFGGDLTEGQPTAASATGSLTKNGAPAGPSATYGDTYGVNIRHPADYPDSGFVAGDTYCPSVRIFPAHGYHGPPGYADADNQEATLGGGCLKVTNKPFFKTYNSSISARNGLTDQSGTCSANVTNSGLLAGWNDNLDGPNADRGSGTQLSALALIQITGVASAQTDINRSPTELTFANTIPGDISSDRNSPPLGGNLGATPSCSAPPAAKGGATNLTGNPAALPSTGNYQYTGNIRLSGGTITGATAIFVKGDVYLNGPIAYDTAGWLPGHVPTFVLVATGNIYIDPGVTQLDGSYIAQPIDSTHGGTIYTCGTATSPTVFTVNDSFSACNNQLMINGSFKADNIKLLRTFGSLRDEESTPGAPATAQVGLAWDTAGPPSGPMPPGNCTQIDEPSDPNTWNDNYLCVPASSSLHLAWTHFDNNPAPGGPTGWYSSDYLKAHGYPYCTKFDIPADYAHTWQDNELCMNQGRPNGLPLLEFRTTADPSQYCTPLRESADPDGTWNSTGYFLCEPPATPAGDATSAAPFTSCQNAGVQMTTDTCAAEVFRFSPELYLIDSPPTLPPSRGAPQYDAITSLPPVL